MSVIKLEESSKNIFIWIQLVFQLSDSEITRKCGSRAVTYFNFQRTLMYISASMTLISLAGPLPANVAGNLMDDAEDAYFAKTTIGNLSNQNPLIWGIVVYSCFQNLT